MVLNGGGGGSCGSGNELKVIGNLRCNVWREDSKLCSFVCERFFFWAPVGRGLSGTSQWFVR